MQNNNKKNAHKEMDDRDKVHYNSTDNGPTSDKIDPMGTEVMQEDEYQKEKHGELPVEDKKKVPEK